MGSYSCDPFYVVLFIWSLLCGPVYVVFSMWLFLCGSFYVVLFMWSCLCGLFYVVLFTWLLSMCSCLCGPFYVVLFMLFLSTWPCYKFSVHLKELLRGSNPKTQYNKIIEGVISFKRSHDDFCWSKGWMLSWRSSDGSVCDSELLWFTYCVSSLFDICLVLSISLTHPPTPPHPPTPKNAATHKHTPFHPASS